MLSSLPIYLLFAAAYLAYLHPRIHHGLMQGLAPPLVVVQHHYMYELLPGRYLS
jgi:hypothetical protein